MAIQYSSDEWQSEYAAELAKRLKAPPPYIYFTPEWVSLYEKLIQNDQPYKEAAKDWEGTVVLHVLADPEHGLDIDLYVLLDLWHGECRSAQIVPAEVGENGDFVITGALDRWVQVGKKELDAVKGMMQGKLKLKGDLPKIVRAVKASQRLTDLSAEVGGKFPTDLSPAETDELRTIVSELGDKFLT
ncbi:MAG TPA: SCP2 sterol-binding domain-containing protein [Candidatus Anoxymicrobiaceae bacterium]|jgi:putative sterol carrier protein